MAEAQQKRLREDSQNAETNDPDDTAANSKRQKPYNNILSLLDEEEKFEDPSQDLSAMLTTLQKELDSPPFTAAAEAEDEANLQQTTNTREEDDGVQSVIRHLLEASDDDLGIPNTDCNNTAHEAKSGEDFPFGFVDDGLWELEDVAANYYAVMQSELFM